MKIAARLSIVFLLIISSRTFSQKLKKADRQTVQNMAVHTGFLTSDKQRTRTAGTPAEQLADEYISAQWKKLGYKPMGDRGGWIQQFTIVNGKEINPATGFVVNGTSLSLHQDFFPFAFSRSGKAEASVSVALAESGVPWFSDLKEIVEDQDSLTAMHPGAKIREKSVRAAAKGATAFIVYNSSESPDLVFEPLDTLQEATIPVVYVNRAAAKKHLLTDNAILEITLSVGLKSSSLKGANVIGFLDNHADSTVLLTAHLDDENDVAELLELSRILKGKQYRWTNFLLAVLSPDKKGREGRKYLESQRVYSAVKVNYSKDLDKFAEKGLPAIQQCIDALTQLRKHETQIRP